MSNNLKRKIKRKKYVDQRKKSEKELASAINNIHLPDECSNCKEPFDKKSRDVKFSGAFNSLYHVRDGELEEHKVDKTSIGGSTPKGYKFKTHELQGKEGDGIYLFSDGFSDQFGGERGKKFMRKNFKEILISEYKSNMKNQEMTLQMAMEQWMGDEHEQVDDILVIGVRL